MREQVTIDGLDVHVRFLRRDDIEALEKAFCGLSRKTILFRFLEPIRRLTPSQLEYLCDVDNRTHVALCAHLAEQGAETPVGVARYVVADPRRARAEFSLVICDRYQNRGIGTHLLRRLVEKAAGEGVRSLRGYVRADNGPMLQMLEKLGATLVRGIGEIKVMDVETGERHRSHGAADEGYGPVERRAGT